MLRYIKVNDMWIDTLREQLEKHTTYIIIDSYVYMIDEEGNEDCIGEIQEESDE